MSDEIGRVFHLHPPVTVRAVQLTADADWEAIAAWCGGQVTTRMGDKFGNQVTELHFPDAGLFARENDWVIRGATGRFFIRGPADFAATYAPGDGVTQVSSSSEVRPQS